MTTGNLIGGDAGHPASGTVSVTDGKIKLENVNISEAPDARVVLTKIFDEPTGVRCGALKGFMGSHEYEIPTGTNISDYNSVIIWCDKFSVPIGFVTL